MSAIPDLAVTPERRVSRAFHTMPFGGIAQFDDLYGDGDTFLERVATNLERLRDVLDRHAQNHEAMAQELRQLRSDRDALRRLLGTVGEAGQ